MFKKITGDKLFINGVIIFLFLMGSNFFNYLYQIFMGRTLSISGYGTLNSLLSLFVIASVPSAATVAFSAKNTSNYLAVNDFEGSRKFIVAAFWKTVLYSSIFLIMFILSIPLLMNFMNIKFYFYYLIVGVAIFLTFPFSLVIGAIQGSKMYLSLGLYSALPSLFKFGFAVLLVYAGFALTGALLSVMLSPLLVLAVSLAALSYYLNININKKRDNDGKNKTSGKMFTMGKPYFFSVFFIMLLFALFTNIDLIMVKHFFSARETGLYSIADILGKIILYFPAAFVLVMFPEVTHARAADGRTKPILLKTLLIVLPLCLCLELFYILFPQDIIIFLMGEKYSSSAALLSLYGLGMFPFAFINILINYFMAINNSKVIVLMLVFSIMEISLLYFFHKNLYDVIILVMTTGWLILLSLSAYAFYDEIVVFLKKFYNGFL